MTIRFLVPASVELDDAVTFYDAQQRGLGSRFAIAVQGALARVARFPESYQRVGKYCGVASSRGFRTVSFISCARMSRTSW